MEPKHYSRAPITESIIDYRTSGGSLESVVRFCDQVADEFPHREPQFEMTGTFGIEAGGQASAVASRTQIGFSVTSADRLYVIQPQVSGLTVSRLRPYETWERFSEEAFRIWRHYREVMAPEMITRLAVRNINRIDIPVGDKAVELSDYLRTLPDLSPDLPLPMNGFFMRVTLPVPQIFGSAIINQTIVPPPAEGFLSVLLDIDVFRSEGCPNDEASIRAFFEDLRRQKNSIFEACITDRSRELFQ